MPSLPDKIKPAKGYAHIIHIGLNILLPLMAYILVRIDFVGLAVLLVLLSKWRLVAVRPRYWLTNLIASSVDLVVGISLILFMANTSVDWWQIFWTLAYMGW